MTPTQHRVRSLNLEQAVAKIHEFLLTIDEIREVRTKRISQAIQLAEEPLPASREGRVSRQLDYRQFLHQVDQTAGREMLKLCAGALSKTAIVDMKRDARRSLIARLKPQDGPGGEKVFEFWHHSLRLIPRGHRSGLSSFNQPCADDLPPTTTTATITTGLEIQSQPPVPGQYLTEDESSAEQLPLHVQPPVTTQFDLQTEDLTAGQFNSQTEGSSSNGYIIQDEQNEMYPFLVTAAFSANSCTFFEET